MGYPLDKIAGENRPQRRSISVPRTSRCQSRETFLTCSAAFGGAMQKKRVTNGPQIVLKTRAPREERQQTTNKQTKILKIIRISP